MIIGKSTLLSGPVAHNSRQGSQDERGGKCSPRGLGDYDSRLKSPWQQLPPQKTAQLIQFDMVTADIIKTRNVGAELRGLNQEGESQHVFVFGFHKAVPALFPRLGSNCDITLS